MAIKKPLVITNGKIEALQAGDGIDAYSINSKIPIVIPTINAIPISDAEGTLNGWVTAGSVNYNFFLTDNPADIDGYYYGYDYDKNNPATSLTSPTLTTGTDQLLWNFVSEAGKPLLTILALGIHTSTLYLSKTGSKDVTVHRELWKRASDGTETLLLSSQASDTLIDSLTQYYYSTNQPNDIALNTTDRLVYKLLANVTGVGTNITVTLDMEGNYDSRISVPVTSNSFNNVFLTKSVYDTDNSGIVDNAEAVIGKVPTATPIANAIPIADSSGTLNSWIDEKIIVIQKTLITEDTLWTDIVPIGYMLEVMSFEETAGNEAILSLGSSDGAADVFTGQTIAASGITTITINKYFSSSLAQSLDLNADQSGDTWNSSSMTVIFIFKKMS